MEVEMNPARITGNVKKEAIINDDRIIKIIECLSENHEIQFKSQQLDETEITKTEKCEIALQLYNHNKLNFISRFGKHLKKEDLEYFQTFVDATDVGVEIAMVLKNLERFHNCNPRVRKNRRYEALKQLVGANTYFSETEMMKRNPLLYEQLVGQYMKEEEHRERDRSHAETSIVSILMEGIERDNARDIKRLQEESEDNAMEEEDSSDDDVQPAKRKFTDADAQPSCSRWGEFEALADTPINKSEFQPKYKKPIVINDQEKALLKDEFMAFMHQSFLEGRDKHFDYDLVDYNENYDNYELIGNDEEEIYFDSESPEDTQIDLIARFNTESEDKTSDDELELYMKTLNEHQIMYDLSKGLNKI